MSEFVRVLREQVDHAHDCVYSAWSAGNTDAATHEAHRLSELLELAQRHGIDTGRWLDPAVRAVVDVARGDCVISTLERPGVADAAQ